MAILIVSFLAIVTVEFFIRMPFMSHVSALYTLSKKSSHVVLSKKISDHWKEIVVLNYAVKIAKHTLIISIMFVAVIPIMLLPAMAIDYFVDLDSTVVDSLATWEGMLAMLIVSVIYIFVRRSFAKI